MDLIWPETFSKRSPIYRQLSHGQFIEKADAALVNSMAQDSAIQVARSGLLDVSVLSRVGFRGNNAPAHLEQAGLPLPVSPNMASVADSGELVLRLSQKEFWVLSGPMVEDAGLNKLAEQALPEADCYPLFCQDSHAWLMLTGEHLADIMAKICGVDLRDDVFPMGSIAQTSVARVNAIVVSHMVNSVPVFSILSDSASAEYLWTALLDAMQEFDGAVVGVNNLVS
jgi:sarcosine oxidase subunit gamma